MSQPPADTRPGWSTRRKVWTVVGSVVGLIVVLAIVGGIIGKPPAEQEAAAGGSAAPTTTEAVTVDAPPPPVAQAPPPPPSPAVPARVHYTSDQVDGALTAAEKRAYAVTLLAEAPSIKNRFERYGADMDQAGRHLTRDGATLCEYIANGESADTISRRIPPRFEVNISDAPAVRRVTEQMVCPKLR